MKGTSDEIRSVLIGFKHEKIGLGEAMKRIKKILYETNESYYNRGHIMGKHSKDE